MLVTSANFGIGDHTAFNGQDVVHFVVCVGVVHNLGNGVAERCDELGVQHPCRLIADSPRFFVVVAIGLDCGI